MKKYEHKIFSIKHSAAKFFCGMLLWFLIGAVQAQITFVGALGPTVVSSGAVSSLSFNAPAATLTNDVMLVQISIRGGTGVASITAPAGWSVAATRVNSGTTITQVVYYRVRTAAETTPYTWNFSPADRAMGALIVYRGVDTASPIDASGGQGNAASTSVTAPAITTTVANTRIVGFFTLANGGASLIAPAGMTGRDQRITGAGPNGVVTAIMDVTQAAVGSTGPKIATSFTSAANAGQLVALRPGIVIVTPGRFNVFEVSTASTAISGPIYTKLAGTGFNLAVVALNTAKTAVLTTFTGAVKVELLDATDNSGTADANNCRSTWTVFQTVSPDPVFVSGDNGRKNVSFQVNDARREVRVRITYPATGTATAIGCSTDNFAIRPTAFTSVTSIGPSAANNTGTGGTPWKRAGSDTFNLTASTGLTNYTGTPVIDPDQIGAHAGAMQVGTVSGSFSDAVAGTASGNAFTYSEVGHFRFLGTSANARGVFDDSFTDVDQANGECTDDFSNVLNGGMYGCKFGITANTAFFGRFTPNHFDVATAVTPPSFAAGCGVFTYLGQPFTYATAPVITVTAMNGADNPTRNYVGDYMKLDNGSNSLGKAPYAAHTDRYKRFDALTGGATPSLDTTGLPAITADPVINTIADASGTVTTLTFGSGSGLSFVRRSTPSGTDAGVPYNDRPFNADIALEIAVVDTDGITTESGDPVRFGTVAAAGGGMSFTGGKDMRYGRLQMSNAHGSPNLNLPIPLETQYWNGGAFVRNAQDSCTTLSAGNIVLGNHKNGVTAANMNAANISPAAGVTFTNGRGVLSLTRPNASGSVDVAINLGTTTNDTSCPAWVIASTGANLAHLRGNWCAAGTNAADPRARATFGIYRSGPIIYMRENY